MRSTYAYGVREVCALQTARHWYAAGQVGGAETHNDTDETRVLLYFLPFVAPAQVWFALRNSWTKAIAAKVPGRA